MIDILGDSWWVVAAIVALTTLAVGVELFVNRPSKSNTQSHRDTILFNQIEEFRRDFS